MASKSKILSVFALLVFGGVGLAYVVLPSEYERNYAALARECAVVTENDEHGRVFEPVVGRYIERKSLGTIVSGSDSFGHQVVLEKSGREFSVLSGDLMSNYKKYFDSFNRKFEDVEYASNDKRLMHFGICASKHKGYQSFYGKIETFRHIRN